MQNNEMMNNEDIIKIYSPITSKGGAKKRKSSKRRTRKTRKNNTRIYKNNTRTRSHR